MGDLDRLREKSSTGIYVKDLRTWEYENHRYVGGAGYWRFYGSPDL